MTEDATKVSTNKATITWAPTGGGGGSIGFTATGIAFRARERWIKVSPEELLDDPLDFIRAGGEKIVVVSSWQWDTATRASLAPYFVSGSSLVIDTDYQGRLASEICAGVLTITPATPASGKVSAGLSMGNAVALWAFTREFEITFRRRKVAEYACVFVGLPDSGAADRIMTLTEVSG